MSALIDMPIWQKNLCHAGRTHDVLVLSGNIRDLYIYYDHPHYFELGFEELLVRLLGRATANFCRFDPFGKASALSVGEGNVFVVSQLEDFGTQGFNSTTDPAIARIHGDMVNRSQRRIWLLKNMHDLLPFRSVYSESDCLRLVAFQNMIENMAPGNKLILCYLSDTQVPVELAQQAHRVAFIKIPLPDYPERRVFWSRLVSEDLSAELAKLTDGMALTSLRRLTELACEDRINRSNNTSALALRDWERAIRIYKFGEAPDYYRQITVPQLRGAFETFTRREGVQGQDHAVKKTIEMLWKARTNVPRLLRSGGAGAPRGALFYVGPSGTGKTMVAKKLAKFVFGSEEAFVRVDMSEYQQDFTVSRLIGAPPGYVGYEAGGVLTNAVLERPFCVLLFDEVEKAHPRVFDLFLQILSDGRLTDSRGQTVFFSEAIIIFTSNIGTRAAESDQLAEAQRSADAGRVRQHFVRCVRNFFRYEISRPELLNRIGNNIVSFDFLEQEDVLAQAVLYYLRLLEKNFNQEYAERNLVLSVDTAAVTRQLVQDYGAAIREFGGRAVLNAIDDSILPQLARQILMLEEDRPSGRVALRMDVGVENGRGRVRVHV